MALTFRDLTFRALTSMAPTCMALTCMAPTYRALTCIPHPDTLPSLLTSHLPCLCPTR